MVLGLGACAEAEQLGGSLPDAEADVVSDAALEGAAGETGVDSGPDVVDAPVDASTEACQCGDPSCGACPMVPLVAAGGYTIDATEVTNEQYGAWLINQPNPALQPPECAWNTSYAPPQGWPAPSASLQHPVVYVDYCDAMAYCRWARRRLCGRVGGGANGFADFQDATKSQWYNACSGGGSKTFPYGAQYNPNACNGADFGVGSTAPVGSALACEGGYPSLLDMSGNVWEWEDSCQGTAGAADQCRIRGGSFSQGASALGCAADGALARNTTGKSVGFRCCE